MARFYILKSAGPPKWRFKSKARRQDALLKRMGSVVTLDLVKGITSFKKRIKPEVLQTAWETGDYKAAMKAMPWDELPEHLQTAMDNITGVAGDGAWHSLEIMPADIRPEMRYDMSNPSIKLHAKNAGERIVQTLATDGRSLIAAEVARWFNEASGPNQVAERIRGSVGLLPAHARAVEKYRQSLIAKGLSPGRVRDAADAYAERLLTYRLRMIAKTETADALVAGRRSVWEGAIAQGLVGRGDVEKTWQMDGNPCPVCISLNGKTVGFDQKFKNARGEVFDDPPTHPHCQCLLTYDIKISR